MSAKPLGLAVKAVIRDGDGKMLVLRRSAANRSFVGCWEWPGGKCEPGEPFDQALVREVFEETGLTVEVTGLAGATSFEIPEANVILLCLNGRVTAGTLWLSAEHDACDWVPCSALPGLELPPQIRPFMLDYASREG